MAHNEKTASASTADPMKTASAVATFVHCKRAKPKNMQQVAAAKT